MSDPLVRRVVAGLLAVAAVAAVAALAGCGGLSARLAGNLPRTGSVIPNATLQATPSLAIPLEKMVFWGAYAGVAYLILDPFAPNWEIEEAPLPGNQVYLEMKMKRYYSGGAGEARVVFQRRAKDLVRYGGFDGYEVLEYNEGLESSVLGSQRVSQGVIRLTGHGTETIEAPLSQDQGNPAPARSIPDSAMNPRS
ncbi:MAG: hypothetical protein HY066_11720 [Betaproteobacteria bacterium]|nr:hypothetical protein [Betaproteobacteria bacterium]